MVTAVSGFQRHVSLSMNLLLAHDEVVIIVDDDAAVREPLCLFLQEQGLAVIEADSAGELMHILPTRNVALILLDIGLPDSDGLSLLPTIVENYPDTSIVMLTGVADLQVALECIRKGADDYLTKPAEFNEILFVVRKTLEKRRLIFENRKYQEDLEKAHFRINMLHQLSVKMNTAYLSTVELDEILRAVLVGITAAEGLRFNRAFLAMFDDKNTFLKGRMAIGPDQRADAQHIWKEIKEKRLNFFDIVQNLKKSINDEYTEINRTVKRLHVDAADTSSILIKSAHERRSIKVFKENGSVPVPVERRVRDAREGYSTPDVLEKRTHKEKEAQEPLPVPTDLITLLGEESFVVVPLFSPSRPFGVIIADNFVTHEPITDGHLSALELFASQASLAIEHSHLYSDMQKKIEELENLNNELDKNKDMLVEAERYAALGHMAAQLVHAIRNPVTSIGGVARILSKKNSDPEWTKYLQVMGKETARLESILEDLFDFVTETKFNKERANILPLIERTVMLVQNTMNKQSIVWEFDFPEHDLFLEVDQYLFRKMVLHLLKNAIDAMTDGGKLAIIVREEPGKVHISLLDTGPGITDVDFEKAKTPFFTTKMYGTGMGLSMVERVVEGHHGHFFLRNRKSGGMEAIVTLPAQ